MDNNQSINDVIEDKLDSDSGEYDIFMGIYELSITLGHYHPNVHQIMRVLAKSKTPTLDSMEVVLLNDIRLRFEALQEREDAEEKPLHEAEQHIYMYLYRELSNIELDERERMKYIKLCCELFDEERRKDMGLEETLGFRLRCIDRLHMNIQKIMARLDAAEEESDADVYVNDSCSSATDDFFNSSDEANLDASVEVSSVEPKEMSVELPLDLLSVMDNSKDPAVRDAGEVSVDGPLNDIVAVPINTTIEPSADIANIVDISAGAPPDAPLECPVDVPTEVSLHPACSPLVVEASPEFAPESIVVESPTVADCMEVTSTLHSDVSFKQQSNAAPEMEIKSNAAPKIESDSQGNKDDLSLEHLKQTQALISEFIQNITMMVKGDPSTDSDQIQRGLLETPEDFSSMDNDLRDISLGLSEIIDTVSDVPNKNVTEVESSLSRLPATKQHTRVTSISPRLELTDSTDNPPKNTSLTLNMKQQTASGCPLKWQHQRHIIAAPRDVLKLLKSNPAYQWPPNDPANAPNLFEQLEQFHEVRAQNNKDAPPIQMSVASIQARVKVFLRSIRKDLPKDIGFSDWLTRVGKCQLAELLTGEEREAYDTWRCQLRDRGGQELTDDDRYRDALAALLGSESPHLKWSALNSRLLLRYPHHQHSISESYLLLALGHVGCLYRSLRLKLQELEKQGESDRALAEYVHEELSTFHEFHKEQSTTRGSLLRLFLRTRGFQQRFQWLLGLVLIAKNGKSCVVSLYSQLGQRVNWEEATLQKCLMIVSNELLIKLNRWLLKGQLPESGSEEFFIVQNLALTTDKFWQERFQVAECFSTFFDSRISMLMISIGRNHMYSRIYLFAKIETSITTIELHYRLLDAFQQFYQIGDQEPLFHLISELHLDVCGKALKFLYDYAPVPLELFQNLHNFLLLRDVHFVRQLIELLEPMLEGPATLYDLDQLNYMLSHMLPIRVPDLYAGEANSEGSKCWSRFVLHWKLPLHWTALLGDNLKQYESLFPGLWRFHHAHYVLCERIMRQNWHFRQRNLQLDNKSLEHVQCHFDKLIDILFELMDVLKSYLLYDVLDAAFAELKLALQRVSSIEEMLQANKIYLEAIQLGSFQMKSVKRSSDYLAKVFDHIHDLEARQQKFYRLFQMYVDYACDDCYVGSILLDRLHDFRLSCQSTCDSLNELEEDISAAICDILLSLHVAGYPAFRLLARKLDSQGYYEKRKAVLRFVDTYAFQRMSKMCEP